MLNTYSALHRRTLCAPVTPPSGARSFGRHMCLPLCLAAALAVAAPAVTAPVIVRPQEVIARLDPAGLGVLPPTGFGAALGLLAPEPGPSGGAATPLAAGAVVLVGAPDDAATGVGRGAVHVFVQRAGGLDRERHLLPATGPADPAVLSAAEAFGAALATDGAALCAIGAPGRDVGRAGVVVAAAGGVTLVARIGGAWQRAAELSAVTPEAGARFGAALALGSAAAEALPGGTAAGSSDPGAGAEGAAPVRVLAVGAPQARAADGTPAAGAVTVFAAGGPSPAPWTPRLELAAPTPALAAGFGAALALVDDAHGIRSGPMATCLAVAAPGDPGAGPGAGAVFLFDLGGRLLDVRRAAPDVHRGQPAGARYGERIAALGGGRIAVAAPARGAVEVLRVEGGTLVREALLAASPLVGFGLALAGAGGELLAIGAPFEGPGADRDGAGAPLLGAGRVHVYARSGEVWCAGPRFGAELAAGATGVEPRDELGAALAIDPHGRGLLVSAPGDDSACPGGTPCDLGAAYLLRARPALRTSCAEGARGALLALGSTRARDRRLWLAVPGVDPGARGRLAVASGLASPGSSQPGASGGATCLSPPIVHLGWATADPAGTWRWDADPLWSELTRRAPGATWTLQVAWSDGRASSAATLVAVP